MYAIKYKNAYDLAFPDQSLVDEVNLTYLDYIDKVVEIQDIKILTFEDNTKVIIKSNTPICEIINDQEMMMAFIKEHAKDYRAFIVELALFLVKVTIEREKESHTGGSMADIVSAGFKIIEDADDFNDALAKLLFKGEHIHKYEINDQLRVYFTDKSILRLAKVGSFMHILTNNEAVDNYASKDIN